MSNLDNITNKIVTDATSEADAIIAKAKENAASILEESRARATKQAEAIHQKAEATAAFTRERIGAGMDLRARDTVLSARQVVVERIFASAADRLIKMDDAEYSRQLEACLKESASDSGIVLLIPASRKHLAPAGIETRVDDSIVSGFKIERDGVIENHDFIELCNFLKEDLIPEVVERLEQVTL